MPDTHSFPDEPDWLALTTIGRQRSGKTTLLNALVQYCQPRGGRMVVLNADQQNKTHSLSTFFPDAKVPPAGSSLMDNRAWIEREIAQMVRDRYHAVLDAGGGWTGFASLVEEVSLHESLEANRVKLIGLVCAGTEQADLDYLSRILDNGAFRPDRIMIVLNSGLITSGRSPTSAFTAVTQSGPVQAAMLGGAKLAIMPALSCMSEVTDRGLTFAEAAEGKVRPGQTPMSLFDPARVREWWTKKMPQFFGQFPAGWLPIEAAEAAKASTVAP